MPVMEFDGNFQSCLISGTCDVALNRLAKTQGFFVTSPSETRSETNFNKVELVDYTVFSWVNSERS